MEADDEGGEKELNTEFLVQEALTRIPPPDVEIAFELRPWDIEEEKLVDEFMAEGCGCRRWDGKACSL